MIPAAIISGRLSLALLFQMTSAPKPRPFDCTVLTTLARGLPSSNDYTTATSGQNWTDMQQVAYVSARPDETTIPLYHHYRTGDHRDSLSSTLNGYQAEGILGYIRTNTTTGMAAIQNLINGPGDFATSVRAIPGFSPSETFGYGYPRYGSQLESFTEITDSGVTLACNKVFGGVLWHITYDGVQFINNFAQGRQIQMSCRWKDRSNALEHVASETGCKRDDYTAGLNQYSAYTHIGSPLVYSYVDTATKRICTQAIPLEFKPEAMEILGGGTWNPILYARQTCSKVITYDYNGMGSVYRFRQTWNFPVSAETDDICQMEASIHLNAGFTNVFRYHPESSSLESMETNWFKNGDSGGFNDSDFGITCYIFGDKSLTHCLGVVAKDLDAGGSWERVTAINGSKNGTGTGEFDNPFNVLYLLNWQPYQAGDNNYYYYLIVGDLTTVTNKAQILHDTQENQHW